MLEESVELLSEQEPDASSGMGAILYVLAGSEIGLEEKLQCECAAAEIPTVSEAQHLSFPAQLSAALLRQ